MDRPEDDDAPRRRAAPLARALEVARAHRTFLVDAGAAVALTLVLAPGGGAVDPIGGTDLTTHVGRTAARLLVAVCVLPLAWRRVRPVASAVAVYVAAAVVALALGLPFFTAAVIAVLVAAYSVTVYGPRWAYRVALGGGLVGLLAQVLLLDLRVGGAEPRALVGVVVFSSLVLVAVWAFALVRRTRRERITALEDRADRLEREREQQARLGAAAERARIARELHDIVAHSLSVMVAQADGGRYAGQADPAAAQRALGTIGETGRAALADMRRLLGVLHEDGGEPPPTTGAQRAGAHAPASRGTADGGLRPQPDVDALEALVEQVRDAGPRVSLVRVGTPAPLPPGAGLTVYRIAQEALTNVLKHAGPDVSVTMVVRWTPESLVLQVDDDGRGASTVDDAGADGPPALRFGVLGMQERAAVFGGRLAVGPRPGGGWHVRLTLPLTWENAPHSTQDDPTASAGTPGSPGARPDDRA